MNFVWSLPQLSTEKKARAATGALCAPLLVFLVWTMGVYDIVGMHNPPLGIVFASALGAVMGVLGLAQWIMFADGVLLAAFCVVSLTPVMQPIARAWVRDDRMPNKPADAIVVLSSGVTGDSTLSGDGLDRLLMGLELLHAGYAPLLLTTRIISKTQVGEVSSDIDQRRIIALTGDEARWRVVDSTRTTHDEANRAALLLLRQGFRSIVVVTTPMHTRRACATFEMAGFSVACVAARERGTSTWRSRVHSERISSFRYYVYERLGMWKYHRNGWAI